MPPRPSVELQSHPLAHPHSTAESQYHYCRDLGSLLINFQSTMLGSISLVATLRNYALGCIPRAMNSPEHHKLHRPEKVYGICAKRLISLLSPPPPSRSLLTPTWEPLFLSVSFAFTLLIPGRRYRLG